MELAITSTSMKLRDRAPVVFRGEDNWCFEQIRSIGYDGVELHIHDSSQLDRKQLKEELDQFGLSLTSIGTGSAYATVAAAAVHPAARVRPVCRSAPTPPATPRAQHP